MNIEDLINKAGDIGSEPDMFHPEYGWIRKDGELTERGKDYFKDQLEKFSVTHSYVGNA